jgi:hypothetical protein
MDVDPNLLEEMRRLFPSLVPSGRAAPHKCEECDIVSEGLAKRPWTDVPQDFIAGNPDVLPLLSQDAYVAYLPAWLREGLHRPDEGAAAMVLISLSGTAPVERFTRTQALLVVRIANAIHSRSIWPADDPVFLERLDAIARLWTP